MRRWPSFVVFATLVALCSASCGKERPPLLGDPSSVTPPAGGEGTFTDGGPTILKCNTGADGGVCDCVDLNLLSEPPTLYFVLDRSGSMNDSNKWRTVRTVVGKTVTQLGPRANFGAMLFPNPQTNECNAGVEVMKVRQGDSPAGSVGTTARVLAAALDVPANGGTPTASALAAAKARLVGQPGKSYVILATDGGPNCNGSRGCSVDECIPNIEDADPQCQAGKLPNCCDVSFAGPLSCLDRDGTLEAVRALSAAGIPVYVIGVPGSGPYGDVLDAIAVQGGTARAQSPRYYRVDSTDASALNAALSQIAAKITATCTIVLKGPPDASELNVYVDDKPVPKEGGNGWELEDATVTLVGETCRKVLAGEVLNVRVVAGCPTLLQ